MVASMEETVDHGAAGVEGFGRDMQCLSVYFYDNYGLILLSQAECFHQDFDTLTEVFGHVFFHTNLANTASMAC